MPFDLPLSRPARRRLAKMVPDLNDLNLGDQGPVGDSAPPTLPDWLKGAWQTAQRATGSATEAAGLFSSIPPMSPMQQQQTMIPRAVPEERPRPGWQEAPRPTTGSMLTGMQDVTPESLWADIGQPGGMDIGFEEYPSHARLREAAQSEDPETSKAATDALRNLTFSNMALGPEEQSTFKEPLADRWDMRSMDDPIMPGTIRTTGTGLADITDLSMQDFEGLDAATQSAIRFPTEEVSESERDRRREGWIRQREVEKVDRRNLGGMEGLFDTLGSFDTVWGDNLAYHITHGVQRMLPGEQGLEKYVKELVGTTIEVIDPFTGVPKIKMITDVNTIFNNGGPTRAPSALSMAKTEGILPWYITEPIKAVVDPLNIIMPGSSTGRSLVSVGTRGMIKLAGSGARRRSITDLTTITDDPFTSTWFGRSAGSKYVQQYDPATESFTPIRVSEADPLRAEAPVRVFWPTVDEYNRALKASDEGMREWRLDPTRDDTIYQQLTSDPGLSLPVELGAVMRQDITPAWLRYWGEGTKNATASSGMELGRLAGGSVVEQIGPDDAVVKPPDRTQNWFGFKSYRTGLSRQDQIRSWVQSTVGRPFGAVVEDPIGSSFGHTYLENNILASMAAKAHSRILSNRVESVFNLDESGRVLRLTGYDETLDNAAPTIQDIAARLPRFWEHLTPDEKEIMKFLRDESNNFEMMLAESGSHYIPSGPRLDVMPEAVIENGVAVQHGEIGDLTGFYLHRGRGRSVGEKFFGVEMPKPRVQLVSGGTPPGFSQEASLPSMAQGIQGIGDKVYKYPSFRESMREYVQDIGESINKATATSHWLTLTNPENGMLRPIRMTELIDPELRKTVTGLRNRISARRQRLKVLLARNSVLKTHVQRSQKMYDLAQRRLARRIIDADKRIDKRDARVQSARENSEDTSFQKLLKEREDDARYRGSDSAVMYRMLGESYERAVVATRTLKENMADIRAARKLSKASDEAMRKSLQKIDRLKAAIAADEGATLPSVHLGRGRRTVELTPTDEPIGPRVFLDLDAYGRPRNVPEGYYDDPRRIEAYIRALDEEIGTVINHWEETAKELDALEGAKVGFQRLAVEAQQGVGTAKQLQIEQFKADRDLALAQYDLNYAKVERDRLERILRQQAQSQQRNLTDAERQLLRNELSTDKIRGEIGAYETELHDLAAEWRSALRISRRPPDDMSVIPLPGLGGYYWPDTMAQAARKYLVQDPNLPGGRAKSVLQGFNSVYRAARGTLDNSAMFVHLLLRFYDNPQSWQRVMRLTFQAWGVPLGDMGVSAGRGERAIDSFFRNFDDMAAQTGRMSSREWASYGLAITGSETEFSLGQGATRALGDLPGIRNANRAFGAAGDAARLEWADDYLSGMMRKQGRTLADLKASGDMEKVARAVNGATGWSPRRFGGNIGDMLLFAPRFFQSRLETLGRAIQGTPLGGVRFDENPSSWRLHKSPATLEQQLAARSMMKMIGIGTMLTVGANAMMGRDTDFNPLRKVRAGTKDEKWVRNTNFMRIRAPSGNDVSLFGTWDSLIGAMITMGLGNDKSWSSHADAYRSMSSGVVSNVWDYMTGADAMGRPTGSGWGEETDWQRMAGHFLQNMTPFFADDMSRNVTELGQDISSGNIGKAVASTVELVGFEFQGGKSYHMSDNEVRSELRQARGQELLRSGMFDNLPDEELEVIEDVLNTSTWKFHEHWHRLPGDVQVMINDDQLIRDKTEDIAERRRETLDPFQGYLDEKERLDQEKTDAIEQAWALAGEVPSRSFRKFLKNINTSHRDKVTALKNSDEYRDVLDNTRERDADEAKFQQTMTRYFDIFASTEIEDALGRIDYDKRNEMFDALEKEVGKPMFDRVQEFLNRNQHPGEKAVRDIQDTLRPYWEIAGKVSEAILKSPDYQDVEKRLLLSYIDAGNKNTPGVERFWRMAADQVGSTIVKDYDSAVSDTRTFMRSSSSESGMRYEDSDKIDQALILGEYSLQPKTLAGFFGQSDLLEAGLR